MTCPDSTSAASADPPTRCAWPTSRADRRVAKFEVAFEPVDERARHGQIVRDDFERQSHARTRAGLGNRLETPAECTSVVVTHRDRLSLRQPQMENDHGAAESRAALIRRARFVHGLLPAGGVSRRVRIRASPHAAHETVTDRGVQAPRGQTARVDPASNLGHGIWFVVVEMRARREHFQQRKAMRGHAREVAFGQSLAMEQMGRQAEARRIRRHASNASLASDNNRRRRANRGTLPSSRARTASCAECTARTPDCHGPSSDSRTCRVL